MIRDCLKRLGFGLMAMVAACGQQTTEPRIIFPDMEPPTPFTRAYVMTESLDGSVRVFAKETGDDTDLYESRKVEGVWTAPVKLEWEKRISNSNPHFSPFDGRLYYATDRAVPGRESSADKNIWSVPLNDGVWGDAEPLKEDVNTGANETSSAMDAKGNLYFVSNHPRGQGGQDIYVATQIAGGSEWRTEFMPAQVNSNRVESHIALTPDGQNIFFYSSISPKLGVVDIKIVSKTDDGGWTAPYNAGPLINTTGIDFGAGASADGKTFFFSREGVLMSLPMRAVMKEVSAARAAFEDGREEEHMRAAEADAS